MTSSMTGVFIKRGHLDTAMYTGRVPCEHEAEIRVINASTSQLMPQFASKPPEVRGEAWNRFFFTANRKNLPC